MNCKKAICVILCFVASLSSWRCFATAHTRDFDGFPGFVFWYDTVYFSPPSEVHVCKYAGTDERVVVPGEINFRWTYPTAPAIETSAKVVGIVDLSGQSYYREDNAFRGNGSVKHVVVNSPIVDIGSRVFSGCLNLMQIDLPDSLRSLGSECFSDCVSLTEITLPDNVRVISEKLFKGCKSLKMVSMPAVTNIGNYAFSDCSQLPAVELPTGIKTIGLGTFSGCSSLETISIPSSITRIRVGAFENCAMLKHIDLSTAIGLRMIESNTFRGCTALTSIEFPNALTNIESSAFEKCGLEVVYIPDEVEEIGSRAFYDCSSLESVRLPAKLSKIGAYAFNGDYNLKKITIPASVKEIGEYAFYRPSDGIFFEGCPPVGPKTIGSAIGYYPVACKAEWQAVIDSEGYWRGLKMEMERGHFYTVKYNPNGATGGVEDQECESGSDGILVDDGGNLHWEGHCFLGWAFAPNGEVVYKKGDYVKEPTEGDVVTLYAKWTDCVVNFNANGGVFKGRTGSAMGGVVTNQFEQYFVYGVPQKLFTDDLVPMRLDGCGNKFLGWVRGKPEITSSDDLIDAGKIWTWDDDVTEETFYAVWTTTLTVNFHHGLSPSSLDDHLKWQLIGKEGSCILKSGESIEVSPGKREIWLYVDAAYDWLVWGFDLGSVDNQNFNAYKGILTLNFSNDYTDPFYWREPCKSTRDVVVSVKYKSEGSRICFFCKHEIRESLRNQIQSSDVPFKASKVSITIEGTRVNESGILEPMPAHTLTGLKPGEEYFLPKGIYRIKSVTYDADQGSGDPYWGAMVDANQTFEVGANEPIDYVDIDFDLFGGGDVVMVKLDPQDGTCEKTCMWYTPAYYDYYDIGGGGTIRGVPHYRIYRMPPDPRKRGAEFGGWFTAPTGGQKVKLMDDIIRGLGETHPTYYAHWQETAHPTYAYDYNLSYQFGEDWQQESMRIAVGASGSVSVQGLMPNGKQFSAATQAVVVNEDEIYVPILANSETGESLNLGIHISSTGEISIDDGAYWSDGDSQGDVSLVSGGYALEVTTSQVPSAMEMEEYEAQLECSGGTEPYWWHMPDDGYLTDDEESSFADVGEAQGWREDEGVWEYELPFSFLCCGREFKTVFVDDNANLEFEDDLGRYASIYSSFGDLYSLGAGHDIFIEQNQDYVTFRWNRVKYSVPDNIVNYAVTLYSNGVIRCSFGDCTDEVRSVEVYGDSIYGTYIEQEGDDDIVFTPNYLPVGLWLNDDGVVSGVPEQAGHYDFEVIVQDDEGEICSKLLSIDVAANPNRRPIVESWNPDDYWSVCLRGGESRSFAVEVSDPDGDELTYRWHLDGVEIGDADGASYELAANKDMRGKHWLTCEVSDGTWSVLAHEWYVSIGGELYTSAEDGLGALQNALDGAIDGDVIYVGPGTYSPVEVPWLQRVRIVATCGYANTIIDGGRAASCVSAAYGDADTNRMVQVEGFTLRDGCAAMGGGARNAWLIGCAVLGNVADDYGGGLCYGRADNCLIAGNSARFGGGAYRTALYNCTVCFNSAYEGYGGGVNACDVIANTIVWGNYQDDELERFTTVNGDPLFVDAENLDFRLAEGSPCIGMGDNSLVATARDLAGNVRIQGGSVDLGAYESAYALPCPQDSTGLWVSPRTDMIRLEWSDVTYAKFYKVYCVKDELDDSQAKLIGTTDQLWFDDRSVWHDVTYRYWVVACNEMGDGPVGDYAWGVLLDPLEIVDSELPAGVVGNPYEHTLEARGGDESYEWRVLAFSPDVEKNSGVPQAGVPMGWVEDDGCWSYELPFEFPVGTGGTKEVEVSDNGYLTLSDGDEYVTLYAAYDVDLYADPGDVYVTVGQDSVTFRWERVIYGTDEAVNVSATLYADGSVRLGDYDNSSDVVFRGYETGSDDACLDVSGDIILRPNALPRGLELGEDGTLSGVPQKDGVFQFVVAVIDGNREYGFMEFSLHVTGEMTDPIPDLGSNPTVGEVREVLEGSADDRLQANITDGENYNAYRNWATTVKNENGSGLAGAQAVRMSPYAWVSFATDSAALLAKMPTDDDLKVEEFKPSAMAGSFDFTVSVKDVTIGDKASVDNLKKLFVLEGAESLDTAAFSSENVSLDFREPQDGKLKFTATPAVDNAKSFFMKAKVK